MPAEGAEVTAADPDAQNHTDHEDPTDYVWDDAQVIPIVLQGTTIAPGGSGVTVAGSKATLTRGGTYRLCGLLADGQIVVDSRDKATVRLVLAGAGLLTIRGTVADGISSRDGLILAGGSLDVDVVDDTLVHIQDSKGQDILTVMPTKPYRSVAFSSRDLVHGSAYEVYCGGSSTGTVCDGLYQGGIYTPGTKYANFPISSMVTNVGGFRSPAPVVRR